MPDPIITNAANPTQVAKATRKIDATRQQELVDFAQIMSTHVGRRFMWRMLEITGFQKTSFTGNSTTFFNEGQRNIGLQLWADMNAACPEQYVPMIAEARERDKRNA
jgi:hypothetical protein